MSNDIKTLELTPAEYTAILHKRAAERKIECDDINSEAFQKALVSGALSAYPDRAAADEAESECQECEEGREEYDSKVLDRPCLFTAFKYGFGACAHRDVEVTGLIEGLDFTVTGGSYHVDAVRYEQREKMIQALQRHNVIGVGPGITSISYSTLEMMYSDLQRRLASEVPQQPLPPRPEMDETILEGWQPEEDRLFDGSSRVKQSPGTLFRYLNNGLSRLGTSVAQQRKLYDASRKAFADLTKSTENHVEKMRTDLEAINEILERRHLEYRGNFESLTNFIEHFRDDVNKALKNTAERLNSLETKPDENRRYVILPAGIKAAYLNNALRRAKKNMDRYGYEVIERCIEEAYGDLCDAV